MCFCSIINTIGGAHQTQITLIQDTVLMGKGKLSLSVEISEY